MRCILFTGLSLLLSSQAVSQDYEDITNDVGIDHTFLDNGTFGGGASFMDFNGDGWDDITFASHYGDSIYFYQNFNGIRFIRVQFAGIETTCQSKQVMWVDLDNDGDQDFFAACHGQPNHLYENTGNMNFREITMESGLDTIAEYTFGTSFGDIDNDGDLEIAIFNRALVNDRNIILYENLGNLQFAEITQSAGVDDIPVGPFCGTFMDYNTDGLVDLYIAQDKYFGNNLFENNGDKTFTDVSEETGLGHALDAMCIAPGDYDNDDDIDIYITNTPLEGNHMFTNNGDGTYSETAAGTPLVVHGYDWGANFLDVENDGDLDLYISGIYTNGSPNSSWLYRNHGGGILSPSVPGMPGDSYKSYSNATGDFNGDGYPDIIVNNFDETRSKLWKNLHGQNKTGGNWIKLRLQGTQSNINGYNTKLEVYAGGKKQLRYTYCGEGFIGQNAAHEIFGLGTAVVVDSVVVTWLSGIVNVLYGVSINQEILVVEGENTPTFSPEMIIPFSILHAGGSSTVFLNFQHGMDEFDLHIYSADGKLMEKHILERALAGRLIPVDMQHWPAGMYVFSISNADGRWSRQVLR
jgi:hypothetical protein